MLYRGYEVNYCEGETASRGCFPGDARRILVKGVEEFDPVHVFECGQCFRWSREPDGSYTGIVRGRAANVSYGRGTLIINNAELDDFKSLWFDYFDLGRDYGAVKKAIATDEIMEKAVTFGGGLRLLRQEPWEVLVSFIISANNRIPRIKKIIGELCRLFGNEIEYAGRKYYGFPGAESLASCGIEQISGCRAGYRCGFVLDAAKAVAEGDFDLEGLAGLSADEARDALMKLRGVGGKVADCFLLFAGYRYDVFPTDVWVKRVMQELYFGREAGLDEIRRFSARRFGEYAGFAQQYLFYYAREHKIGI